MKLEVEPDFIAMRMPFSQRFYEVFHEGFIDYINGDW